MDFQESNTFRPEKFIERTNVRFHKLRENTSYSQKQTVVSKHSQIEDQDVHVQRLMSLHSEVDHQMELLQKYQVDHEMDMERKEKNLMVATDTIESQRKSILELQLQNEKLSSQLNDEIQTRKEVLQKVETNRSLCSALKEHSERINEYIKNNNAKYEEVVQEDIMRKDVVEGLIRSFKDLKVAHSEKVQELQSKYQQKYDELMNQNKKQTEVVKELTEKFKLQSEEQQKNLDEVKMQLKIEQQFISKEKKDFHEKMMSTNSELLLKQETIKNLEENIDQHKEQIEVLQNDRKEQDVLMSKQISDLQAYTGKVASLNELNDEIQKDLTVKQRQLEMLKCENQNLVSSVNNISEELTAAKDEITLIKNCKEMLVNDVTRYKKQLEDKEIIEDQLSSVRSDFDLERKKSEKIMSQLEYSCDQLNLKKEQLEDLQQQVLNVQELNQNVQAELSSYVSKDQIQREMIEKFKSEVETYNTCVQEFQETVNIQENKMESLRSECSDLKKQIETARQDFETEKENHTCLQSEFKLKVEENESLLNDVTLKAKEVDEVKSKNERIVTEKNEASKMHKTEITQMWDIVHKNSLHLEEELKIKNTRVEELEFKLKRKASQLIEDTIAYKSSPNVAQQKFISRKQYNTPKKLIHTQELKQSQDAMKYRSPNLSTQKFTVKKPCYTPKRKSMPTQKQVNFRSPSESEISIDIESIGINPNKATKQEKLYRKKSKSMVEARPTSSGAKKRMHKATDERPSAKYFKSGRGRNYTKQKSPRSTGNRKNEDDALNWFDITPIS